jgi:hypothetical protein
MPSQLFKITRAPEAKPITAQRLHSLLWRNPDGEDSDLEVKEIVEPVTTCADTRPERKDE